MCCYSKKSERREITSQRHKSKPLFSKIPVSPRVCQHLIQRQSHLLSKSPLAPILKIKTIKCLHFSGIPSPNYPRLSSSSNEILHCVMSCFSGELPPRLNKAVCASRITSKIAYHNEWAAGPPSSTTDTTVVVFPSRWQ